MLQLFITSFENLGIQEDKTKPGLDDLNRKENYTLVDHLYNCLFQCVTLSKIFVVDYLSNYWTHHGSSKRAAQRGPKVKVKVVEVLKGALQDKPPVVVC